MNNSGRAIVVFEARGLSRLKAAAYIGVSPTKFDELVKSRRMPAAKRIDGRKIWDRRELDDSFETLPQDGVTETNPWNDVL
jgi:hypothetical protein